MKGRAHKLNLDPNFDPLNPAHVSDPACWLSPQMADQLYYQLRARLRALPPAEVLAEPQTGIWFVEDVHLVDDQEVVFYCEPATVAQPEQHYYWPPHDAASQVQGYSLVNLQRTSKD